MLTYRNTTIRVMAKSRLISSAKAERVSNSHFTLIDAISWVNTTCTNTRGNSWWDKIREAIRLGRELHNILIKLLINDGYLINIGIYINLPDTRSALVSLKDVHKLSKLTIQFFLDSYRIK